MFFLAFTISTLRLARRFKPDVMHAHWWLPAGVCALLVPDGSAMVVHDFTHLTFEAAQLLGRRQDVGA